MPAFDKRGFIYTRKSDEYAGNHPNWQVMKMNGFTVPVIRPPSYDPFATATAKSARENGLFPALWEVPIRNPDGSVKEDPIVFANRLSAIVGDMDKAGAYVYAIIPDNENCPRDWHMAFAPALAQLRTRKKILSIDPLKGDMWNDPNIYTAYVNNGFSIDVQCYDGDMKYYNAARCWSVVCATPYVPPWTVRVTLPPGKFSEIQMSGIQNLGPIGIGFFAPSQDQMNDELPKWGQYISGAVLPKVLAYK